MLGRMIPGFGLFSSLLGIAAFIAVAVLVYELFFASPSDLTNVEQATVEAVVAEAAPDVIAFAIANEVRTFRVARLQGDSLNGMLRAQLIRALAASEAGLTELDGGIGSDFTAGVDRVTSGYSQRGVEVRTHAAALEHIGEDEFVDLVLFGEAGLARPGQNESVVRLDLHLQGRRADARLNRMYERASWDLEGGSGGGGGIGASLGSFAWRVSVFAVVGFFLPILAGGASLGVLRKQSNAANLGLLAVFSLAIGALAWALTGFGTQGGTLAVVLIALALGGVWSYRVLEVWERRA